MDPITLNLYQAAGLSYLNGAAQASEDAAHCARVGNLIGLSESADQVERLTAEGLRLLAIGRSK